jgi:CRISPR/Cas system-associated exonuclease Cas4 (RecB family)
MARPEAVLDSKKEVKENKREQVSKNTKKILDESDFEDYSDLQQANTKTRQSDGFDVVRFESLMRSKLIDEYKKKQSYERPYISCTELYTCIRQSYYTRQRYQADLREMFKFPYLYLMQKAGNLIHEIFQDLYNFTEIEKTIVSEKYKVKGRVDAIRDDIIYEIKTLDPPKFEGRYIREHYYQGVIYAHILKTEYDYDVNLITIIYVLRDLKQIHPFDLPTNDDLAKKFLGRGIILKECLSKNIVPDPLGATKDQCKYCLYRKYCEKDECETITPPYVKKEKPKKKDDAVFLL